MKDIDSGTGRKAKREPAVFQVAASAAMLWIFIGMKKKHRG
ncbi:MAG: hypothetical protein WAT64_12345 [Dokdonella sp.]